MISKKSNVVKATTDNRTYKIFTTIDKDPYPDAGYNLDKNGLYGRERRQLKNWKNYRKKQYRQ